MTKIIIDPYKMNESKNEVIDEDGELLRIDLVLEENNTPIVLDGKITGKITDDFGFPIVGAKITLKYNSDKTIFKEVYSDSNHTFLFTNVPENTDFQISASHIIYIPKTLTKLLSVKPFETIKQDITLTSILGILFGILLDIYRKPVALAFLFLYLIPPPPATPILIATTKPEKDGNFIFPEVPFGNYELVAQTDLYKDVSTTFNYDNPNTPLELNLEFEEEKPATIVGRITDTTSLPLYGAIVTLKTYPEYLDVTKVFSDILGNYIIINVVPNKSFVVSAIKDQYVESTSNVITPSPASISTQNLTLNDLLGSIVGTLLGTDSKPVSGNLSLYSSLSSIPLKTTIANSTGSFSFTGIARGNYTIKASNPLYKDVSNSYSYTDANFPLSVTLKFLEVNTAKITGKIIDSKSNPIFGATITLKTSPGLTVVTTVSSDALGNYSILDVLADKSYVIHATKDQYISSTSNVITPLPGTFVTQNLTLNDLLGSIVGTLLGSDSKPVSGSLSLSLSSSSTALKTTIADTNGNFSFTEIARGNYTIKASNPLYKDVSNSYSYADANVPLSVTLKFLEVNKAKIIGTITDTTSLPLYGAIVTLKSSPDLLVITKVSSDASGNYSILDVTPNKSYVIFAIKDQYVESTSNVITPSPGSTVTQNLTLNDLLGSITGTLLGSDSKPVSGTLSLSLSSSSTALKTTTADTNGNFSFTKIARGNYTIKASNPIYKDVSNSYSYTDANFPLSVTLKFLEVNTAKITGKIIDSESNPISDVTITLKTSPGLTVVTIVSSDASGNYSILDITPNSSYVVSATKDQYVESTSNIITPSPGSTVTQDFTLKDLLGSINGTLLDTNSNPVSLGILSLYNSLETTLIQSRSSDSNGEFTFSNIPHGNYVITAQETKYQDVSTNIPYPDASSPLNINIQFTQTKPAQINGKVLDTKNNPISGASLKLTKQFSPSVIIDTTTSDSTGNYSFNNVKIDAAYVISAEADQYISDDSSPIEVSYPNAYDLNITLNDLLGSITGNILDISSNPIIADLSLYSTSTLSSFTLDILASTPLQTTKSNSSGNFTFTNVTRGSYQIVAQNSLYKDTSKSFSYTDASIALNINFQFTQKNYVNIQGKVTNIKSQAIQGSKVTVKTSSNSTVLGEALTDSNGNYTLNNISLNQSFIIYATKHPYQDKSSSTISSVNGTTLIQDFTLTVSSGTIAGRVVTSSSSSPVNNVMVRLFSYKVSTNFGTELTNVYTNNLGNYTFTNVSTNQSGYQYYLRTYLEGYANYEGDFFTFSDTSVPLILNDINITTTLKSISCDFKDSFGIPILNATITLKSYPSLNVIGNLEFISIVNVYAIDGLETGDYILVATAPGYSSITSSVIHIVFADTHIDINLTSKGSGSISGKIFDPNWYGISNAKVSLYYLSTSRVLQTTTTDSLARFSFNSLSPTNYFIGASASGYESNYSGNITVNNNSINSDLQLWPIQYAPSFDSLTVSTPSTYNPITTNAIWGQYYSGAILNFDNQFVDYLGGFLGGRIEVIVSVPISSRYFVKVRYLAGDRDRQLKIRVTSGATGYPDTVGVVSKTNSWNVSDARIGDVGNVYLNQGSNTLVFFNDTGSYAPAISNLYFMYSPSSIVASVTGASRYNGAYNQQLEYWGNYATYTVGIGGPNYGYVLMDYNFPVGGKYTFYFRYLSGGSSKPLAIDFLGNTNTYTFPQTASSWLIDYKFYGINFYSPPGKQTFKFYGSGTANAPALSIIDVYFTSFLKTVSSYQFALTGSAYMSNNLVTGISSQSGSMIATVSVDAPGYYDLSFKYYDPNSGRKMKIKINGVDNGSTYDLSPTDNWWTSKTFTVKLYLNKWTNTIEVYL